MASFLDSIKVKTATDKYTELDLSSDHITTANFMQFNIAYAVELVPNQKIDINMSTFARLQPLPVPTYGKAKIQNRAFFVPFRTIFPAFNDFITDARHSTSDGSTIIYTSVPTFSHETLVRIFSGVDTNLYGDYTDDVDNADFKLRLTSQGTNAIRYIKLTKQGRWALKLLNSLGYQFFPESTQDVANTEINYSALPLLAVAKVYADWYYPSMYVSSPDFAELEALFNKDTGSTILSVDDILMIFRFLQNVNYDSDYFTSAWQNPVAPNDGTYSPMTINDFTDEYTSSGVNNMITTSASVEGTPLVKGPGGSMTHFSQYALNVLRSMTDYLKRHQLVGGRALDRYLSRFGVKLSDEILKRSTYVGTSEQYIQFGDVMSQSDTYNESTEEGSALGAYAGKGIGYVDGNFSYENEKEYGMLIIVSTIVPKTGYYQGIDRSVMHTTRLDYWTPEFDNLGVQAVSKAELYVPDFNERIILGRTAQEYWQSVFGFVPRYAEYKVGKDRLTGDFRVNSINRGMDSWHTFRIINPSDYTDIAISEDFVSGQDASQYSRIFNNYSDEYDKFIVIHNFSIKSNAPFASYWDTYDFESNGNTIVEQANGVKMN